jgi:excisionase family DNA binding protein
MGKLLSIAEVQEILGVSRPTVLRLIAADELPTIQIRRRRLVEATDLAAFIADRRTPKYDEDPAAAGPIVRASAEAGGGDDEG